MRIYWLTNAYIDGQMMRQTKRNEINDLTFGFKSGLRHQEVDKVEVCQIILLIY